MLSADEFRQLAAAGHNRIPVVREVLSDLDTPLSVYLKLADGPHTYLFESVEGGETWGRYSIIGLPARRTYSFSGRRLDVRDFGEIVESRELDDPLAEIDRLRESFRVPKLPELPAFTGGLVGYFGFETIGWIEPRLDGGDKPDQLGTPDALLMLSEEVAVFDNLKGRLYLVVHADTAEPQAWAKAQLADRAARKPKSSTTSARAATHESSCRRVAARVCAIRYQPCSAPAAPSSSPP